VLRFSQKSYTRDQRCSYGNISFHSIHGWWGFFNDERLMLFLAYISFNHGNVLKFSFGSFYFLTDSQEEYSIFGEVPLLEIILFILYEN
jgi:hypothetical protein